MSTGGIDAAPVMASRRDDRSRRRHLRAGEKGGVQRRWAGKDLNPLALDLLEQRFGTQDPVRIDRQSVHQRGQPTRFVPESMEERIDDAHTVRRP